MKLALISDIHGNYHALEAVLADIRRQQADQIIVLGDLVFKGPLPERCVQAIRELNTTVLQGNIDELVGKSYIQPGFAKSPEHEAAIRKEMEWTQARLTEEELQYLTHLPLTAEEALTPFISIRCVHATPQNLLDIVLPTDEEAVLERMIQGSQAQIIAYGHIHQGYIRNWNGRTIVNTGSVGLPFDGNPQASYAMVEVDEDQTSYAVTLRRVTYPVEDVVQALQNSDHPYSESVINAIRAGRRPV